MDFQKIMDYRNTHNPFCQRLGIVVEALSPGCARVTKQVTEADLNPVGVPHGGLYFALADTACGSAAATHGRMAVTVDAGYHFFRSARPGDILTAQAQETKSGRTLCVYDVRVTDQKGALLGTGTFTFCLLDQEIQF